MTPDDSRRLAGARSCPNCDKTDLTVALITEFAVYFRCSTCGHTWSLPKHETEPDSGG